VLGTGAADTPGGANVFTFHCNTIVSLIFYRVTLRTRYDMISCRTFTTAQTLPDSRLNLAQRSENGDAYSVVESTTVKTRHTQKETVTVKSPRNRETVAMTRRSSQRVIQLARRRWTLSEINLTKLTTPATVDR